MSDLMITILALLDSTLRLSTPLVLAGLAGLYAERSGVVDISLEGKLLLSAFAAASAAAVTGSPWVGLAAGIGASVLLSLVHAWVAINQHGNQIVSATALNLVAAGLAPTLANSWFRLNGQTPLLAEEARFSTITLPGVDAIEPIPVIGPIYAQVISGHNLLTYLAILVVPLAALVLYRTWFGLRLRAAGEHPEAVEAAGHNVRLVRYQAMVINGILCGIGGSALSVALGAAFVRDMSAGKGFLALAAMVFAKWRPVPTLLACLLFGFVDGLQANLQGTALPLVGVVPSQIAAMLPYILTIVVLAGFIGRIDAPRAAGQPYRR